MPQQMQYFAHHYAPIFWIVGLIFGAILLVGYIFQKHNDKKFDRLQQLKEQKKIEALKNRKQSSVNTGI